MSDTTTERGTVRFFSDARQFGFVIPDQGAEDIYIPGGGLTRAGIETLDEGDRIEFRKVRGHDGRWRAHDLRLAPTGN